MNDKDLKNTPESMKSQIGGGIPEQNNRLQSEYQYGCLEQDNAKPFFTRNETNIIKGIALLCMFLHHFFTFPEWWIDGISYPIIEKLAPYFCEPLKICVPVFCFITGYCYFYNNRKSYKYSLKKITDVLISYWFVFLIFALVAFFAVGYHYSIQEVILEAFALYRPTMVFCWYVYFYILIMLALPIFTKIVGRNIHVDLVIIFIAFRIAMILVGKFLSIVSFDGSVGTYVGQICNSFSSWFPCVIIGYLFARYKLFQEIGSVLQRITKKWVRLILLCVFLIASFMGRYFVPDFKFSVSTIPIINKGGSLSISIDPLYAALFVFSVICLSRMIKMQKMDCVIQKIGKHSLSMWFVHCLFFNNSKMAMQKILYFPENPVLVFVWGVILCLGISISFDFVTDWINGKKNILFKGV